MKKEFQKIAVLVAVMAVCSMGTGCTSNGKGPWYNPSSYTYHNPFAPSKNKDDLAGHETDKSVLEQGRPSLDSKPNINPPMGGYTNKAETHPGMSTATVPATPGAEHGSYAGTSATPASTAYPNYPNPYAAQTPQTSYPQQTPSVAMVGGYSSVDGTTTPQTQPIAQASATYPQNAQNTQDTQAPAYSPYPAGTSYPQATPAYNTGTAQPAATAVPQTQATPNPYGAYPTTGAYGEQNAQPASPFQTQAVPAATGYPASAFGAQPVQTQVDPAASPYQYRATSNPYVQ